MREGTKMVDETNNANQSGSDENKQKELQQAIERVNRGLEDLTPDELSRIYRILKAHNGEIGDAGTAFARLDEFAQKKVKDFADGKENLALEDMNGIVALEAELAAVHQPDADRRQTPATDRVNRERRDFDAKNGLTHLTPSSKEFIDKNLAEMDAVLKDFDAFGKDKDGKLLHPEMANVVEFFEHIDLQAGKEDGIKSKDELRREMLEMAILQAESELAVNPAFAGLSSDEKRKRLLQAIGSHADAMAFQMLDAQLLADFKVENAELLSHKDNLTPEEEEELEKKVKEFNDKVKAYKDKYPSGNYSLRGTTAAAVIIANGRNQVAVNSRIAEKTGHLSLKERALKFDARMKEKHPKLYAEVKKAMVSTAVGLTTGGVGLAVLSAYRSVQLVRKSYQTYRESGFDGSYWTYLRKNPKELLSLSSSIVLSGVSITFGGIDVAQHGWNAVGFVGRAIGDTAAAKAGDRLLKAAIRGTISVTSGLTNAGMDFRAALNEKDKDRRKKLYKQAAVTAGLSVLGGAVGIFSAEYSDKLTGWLRDRFASHDDTGVDGITGAAPKVQPQQLSHTPDLAHTNENQLDAKLHELGVNPKVYENMSPAQKAILLDKRVEELGPLAKETPTTEKQEAGVRGSENGNQGADTGLASEAQLKNMLARNAERHPDVDMNKVYSQLKAAGIKNPEEAFYKLEQARLLAPNDKIMTVDGTNIRDTFSRALKGEALSKADMEIISRSSANVDSTGHYLNDVRAQGGTGYSYRPNGNAAVNEADGNTPKTGAGTPKTGEARVENPENQPTGTKMLDIEKMSEADRKLYENMMRTFQDGKTENWQFEANKAYLQYCQLRTDGKTEEAEAFAKTFAQKPEASKEGENENVPAREQERVDKDLLKAQNEAALAERAWKESVEKVSQAEKEVSSLQHLPVDDPRRIEAERKLALSMKDEVKKQMEFSKKEIKLAKAERNHLGDEIKDRLKMERRMTEIQKDLKKYGIDKTTAPEMTGDYRADKQAVREYYKDVLSNQKHYGKAVELLKEREELLARMKEQGPRQIMEQRYAEAEAKVDELSKRGQYRENQEKETAAREQGEWRTLQEPEVLRDQTPQTPSQPTENDTVPTEKKESETRTAAPEEKKQEPVPAASQSPRNESNTQATRLDANYQNMENAWNKSIDRHATITLADAEKLPRGAVITQPDKQGNLQYAGVTADGHAFRMTEVHVGSDENKMRLRIEVDKDHPMYNELNSGTASERQAAKTKFYQEVKSRISQNNEAARQVSGNIRVGGRLE